MGIVDLPYPVRGRRRSVAVLVAAAVLAAGTAACSSSRDGISGPVGAPSTAEQAAQPAAEPTADAAPATAGPEPTAAASSEPTPTGDAAVLASAGIQIVASDTDEITATAPLTLTQVQADRLAAQTAPGEGMLGRDLDARAPVPEGTPPASYLLAAWVSTGTSPAAEQARTWMGEQDWTMAPDLVFPAAAVAMFVNEMAADTAQLPEAPAETPAQPPTSGNGFAGRSLALPVNAPALDFPTCSAVTGFLSSVFNGLFDALKINPTTSGGGILDFVGSVLASVWNTAVGLAKDALAGLITTLTAPVFNAIRTAVGALGVATVVLSYFTDQTLDVQLQTPQTDPDQYPFAVGEGPDVTGTFVAKGRELTGDWPAALTDCATVAGAPLPKLIAPGSPANWTVDASDLIVPGPLEGVVGPDGTATLTFVTGRESEDDAKGEAVHGTAYVSVKIPRKEVQDFLDLARAQIEGVKAQLLGVVPGPLRGAATNLLASTVDPTIAQLSNTLAGAAGGPLAVEGSSRVIVLHHKPPDTTLPPEPTAPDDDNGDDDGDFCAQYVDMSRWTEANAGGNLAAFGAELVRRLNAMRPSAPDEMVPYVDVLLSVYGLLASTGDYLALADQADELGDAARVLGTYCGLG